MKRAYLGLLALLMFGVACRPLADAGDGPDAAVGPGIDGNVVDAGTDFHPPDAGNGACTMKAPRVAPPEPFVGPFGLEARMIGLIDSAKTSLDLEMYLFTSTTLANRIVAAKNRGVAVRVLLDPDHAGNGIVTPTLTSGNVKWKWMPTVYTYSHAKFMIIDKVTTVIMSMNWNKDAFLNERNYGIIDRDPEDIADVQAIFEQDWGMANGLSMPAADISCTRLIVSPTNAKQRLVEFINSAQTTLDLELMYISETSIRTAVAAAKQRGVYVRALMQQPTGDDITWLKSQGIAVRTLQNYYLHAKLIIADQVAFVGSENMSWTSLTKNREVGALVFEPTAFTPIKQQFNTDWNNGAFVP